MRTVALALAWAGAATPWPAVAEEFTIGGAVYTNLDDPLTSGLAGVTVTVEGEGGGPLFTAVTDGVLGIWFVEHVPEGLYRVTPQLPDHCFRHVMGGVPGDRPPITVTVDAEHRSENLSIQFFAESGDCPAVCGDGTCGPGEDCDSCPEDCDCACPAARDLSDPRQVYCPGESKRVHIGLNVPPGVTAVAIEDAPPAGWEPISISAGGLWDVAHGKVKWGPFFEPFPGEVWYDVIPPSGDDGVRCFSGTISLDGENHAVCGDACIDGQCCPFMAADEPQPPCAGCSDCAECGACEDRRVVLCEMAGYACAWSRGCNDDLAGMTRAAFIWKTQECYCWREDAAFWFGIDCRDAGSGCCPPAADPAGAGPTETAGGQPTGTAGGQPKATAGGQPTGTAGAEPTGTAGAERVLPRRYRAGRPFTIAISIVPPPGVIALALEDSIPKGWTVSDASDGGSWVPGDHSVRWGPFFTGAFPAEVRYEVTPPPGAHGARCLAGAISFDGFNEAIGGVACTHGALDHDSNGDGSVDLDDYTDFWRCAAIDTSPGAPGGSSASDCLDVFDSDGNDHVDLLDWGTLQALFGGSE